MIVDAYRKYAKALDLEERPALETALEELEKRGVVVLRAPTGYGKSLFSVAMGLAAYEELWQRGIAKVIHVIPMSSIVEDLYSRALERLTRKGEDADLKQLENALLEKYPRRWVGYQSWAIDADFKDPLYIWSSLVYTTFDSFVLNLYKITPLRAKRAPYESARSAIIRSLVILDEAHLMADPRGGKSLAVFIATIKSLRKLGVPVLIATATISDTVARLIKNAVDDVKIVASTVKECGKGGDVLVHDYGPKGHVDAYLKAIPLEELKNELKSQSFKKALLIFNTVDRAVRAYRMLRGEYNAVLLHGRLTLGDRSEAVMRAKSAEIVVATQVVEAGVDIDSDLLITDIAPFPNLIQRFGRVARREIKRGTAIINIDKNAYEASKAVYGENETEVTSKLLREYTKADKRLEVEWRNPCPEKNTYALLLEEFDRRAYPDIGRRYDVELSLALQTLNDLPTLSREDARNIMEKYCGFVRDAAAVPLIDPECYNNIKKPDEIRRCILLVSSDFLNNKKEYIITNGTIRVVVEALKRVDKMRDQVSNTLCKDRGVNEVSTEEYELPASMLFNAKGEVDCRKALALDYYVAKHIGTRAVVLGVIINKGYVRGEGLI
ncbi:helicase, probable [Pyrobaculum aerophilum str. IM2]|uniref:Helicase, probable n=2 Tax=Pyrobaculum aerophilum TaxID=13773 RepID=Q8ZZV0_PYRAE|nr:CRISPR-associated helicase Cas3' [Pyrobaculum aerophilum]AAL62539.1 helicase, probable [Pyrobaculum aerophilum str. IM2]HII47735.1 CRISPR-associated helicase Cas3' [Pyrobaculum aerophilum]